MTGRAVLKKTSSLVSLSIARLKGMARPLWGILTLNPLDEIVSPKRTLAVAIEKNGISAAFGSRFFSHCAIRRCKKYPAKEDIGVMQGGLNASVALAAGLCSVHALEAMHDLGAMRSDVTLCIPKSWTIVKTAEFPSIVKENIHNVVSYELDRLTPFSPDDAMYDFRVVKEHEGRLTLQIVAARSDSIIPFIESLKEKGVRVGRVTLTLSSLGTLCHFSDRKGNFLFAEVDEEGYEGATVIEGVVTRVFTGSFGEHDTGQRAEVLKAEIEPIIRDARDQGRPMQVALLLQNGDSKIGDLIKSDLSMPVSMINGMDLKLKLPRNKQEVSYTAVGGALESLWPKAKGFNLLARGHHEKPKTPMAVTVILIIVLAMLGILYLLSPLKAGEKRLKEIDRQIAMRKDDVKKVESLKKEIESLKGEVSVITGFKGNKPMALDILKELTIILPKTSWLTRARITETAVEIEGYAASATELLPKLEASKYFQKAEFSSPTFRDPRMNMDRFIMKMEIKGIKKTEGEKGKKGTKHKEGLKT
jgi:Tfp pilus assembly protein PilN